MKEPYKITYILGAGASAKALPMIKQYKENLGMEVSLIDMSNNLTTLKYNDEYQQYVRSLIKNLINLASKTKEFGKK